MTTTLECENVSRVIPWSTPQHIHYKSLLSFVRTNDLLAQHKAVVCMVYAVAQILPGLSLCNFTATQLLIYVFNKNKQYRFLYCMTNNITECLFSLRSYFDRAFVFTYHKIAIRINIKNRFKLKYLQKLIRIDPLMYHLTVTQSKIHSMYNPNISCDQYT